MSDKSQKVTDPVCGMSIDPASAAGTAEHEGTTYHFCSKHCADTFSLNPKKFFGHPARPNPYRLSGQ